MAKSDFAAYVAARKAMIDDALASLLPDERQEPVDIHRAMRHAVLGGGKRLRPVLTVMVAEAAGREPQTILPAACAVEFVHAASLVLDDLPSMDNAGTRRGKPCVHLAFGEATAILAATALISFAFRTLAAGNHACDAIRKLAEAIGPTGIVAGQHDDLRLTGQNIPLNRLAQIYADKAGALFRVAVEIPALLLGMPDEEVRRLALYGSNLGVAFQIVDDLIDAGKDEEDGDKTTFSTHLGRDGARKKLDELIDDALAAIAPLGDRVRPLVWLAEHVKSRAD